MTKAKTKVPVLSFMGGLFVGLFATLLIPSPNFHPNVMYWYYTIQDTLFSGLFIWGTIHFGYQNKFGLSAMCAGAVIFPFLNLIRTIIATASL